MKKLNLKLKNNRKGITLIALVITIIVLLILAGVTIATLTGENGILTQANKAKEKNEVAKEDELRKLTAIEAATYLEEHKYEDPSGETITIPAQCAVSQVEGENTLKDGLVIIDKNGNEWVWIEVPESVMAGSTTDGEIENALMSYVTNYRGSYSDTWYEGCGLEEQEYADRYSEMLQSIKANNGFYTGRYEVGSFDNPVTANDITRKAVIQKEAYPYNYVTVSQAEELSEGLAIGNKTCSLMFGIQWDLILKYLELNGDWDTTINEASYYLKENSNSWGNYLKATFSVIEGSKYAIYINWALEEWKDIPKNYNKPICDTVGNGILLSTGASKRNSKLNIYDFAGNICEFTLEKSTSNEKPYVYRGGNCSQEVSNLAFSHGESSVGNSSSNGFRPALY